MHFMRPTSSYLSNLTNRAIVFRRFLETETVPSLTRIIPGRHRSRVIQQAQEILTDYLHSTRALPFIYAELISHNSTHSLSQLISKVPFESSSFSHSFQKFLRYNPINELGFFFESIGIRYADLGRFLKPNLHFFYDDSSIFDVACFLADFGFPWDKLGGLYVEEASIFETDIGVLRRRLDRLVSLGFGVQQIVAICLAFPCLLKGGNVELGSDFDSLLDDLKRVFVDFDFGSSLVRNVDVWFEICGKIQFFYDLGVAKGQVGELLVKGRSVLSLIDFPEKVLVEKVEFFSRLGFGKAELGLLILSYPEILSIKLDDRVISVLSLLDHFGLCKKQMKFVEQNYKHVFGRNKMMNLPNILRAMDLREWFVDRIKCGYHHLFANYDLSSPNDGVDDNYIQKLENIKSVRTYSYSVSKLEFLHGLGFGENRITVKVLVDAHSSASGMQERFDFLLSIGIEFSKLCKMISRVPRILNQDNDSLKNKLDFFFDEIGLSLEDLDNFPSYLVYSLEKRIKPRYEFHEWLIENRWCTKKYTLSSIISVSHNGFMRQLSCIHPTAPQLWKERHGDKKNRLMAFNKNLG